jgi:bifunctional non-homologous end joining protein LigD
MGLSEYRKKRSFKKTKEPKGQARKSGQARRFVIQKHDASRLHYDFRLEVGGVLKSWAVPKGPSTNPRDKRFATMVEDHPFDYRDFEGVIPEGNYGGGTVMVWDEGVYAPLDHHTFEAPPLAKQDAEVKKQLKAGALKIGLLGTKMKGIWNLVKFPNAGPEAWLLLKHPDKYAKKSDILKKDRSAKTDRTMLQIAKAADSVWQSKKRKR